MNYYAKFLREPGEVNQPSFQQKSFITFAANYG
jgi:hypothetical protein